MFQNVQDPTDHFEGLKRVEDDEREALELKKQQELHLLRQIEEQYKGETLRQKKQREMRAKLTKKFRQKGEGPT